MYECLRVILIPCKEIGEHYYNAIKRHKQKTIGQHCPEVSQNLLVPPKVNKLHERQDPAGGFCLLGLRAPHPVMVKNPSNDMYSLPTRYTPLPRVMFQYSIYSITDGLIPLSQSSLLFLKRRTHTYFGNFNMFLFQRFSVINFIQPCQNSDYTKKNRFQIGARAGKCQLK